MAIKPVIPDQKLIKEYLFNGKRNIFYDKCSRHYHDFMSHSDGVYPESIIERQRPNEPQNVKDFRKEIWQPITKPTFSRVVSSLSKIRRSSDWAVKYPESAAQLSQISEQETLEKYCEEKFPFFTSVTNWVFDVLLKQYLIDPNAVIFVLPLQTDNVESTKYLQPYPNIFNCPEVLDYSPGEYAVLNIIEGSSTYQGGKAIYFINTNIVQRWEQVSQKAISMTWQYNHELNMLPVFKLGGIICKTSGYNFMYESRISGILPNLNESVAEYTDLQAAKRLHVYPERWEYSQHECAACKGTTVIRNPNYRQGTDMPATIACTACGGLGYVSGPYSKLLVKPVSAGTNQIPTPPAGFIEKDVEIVKIMDESWRRHIYDALAAINFQFLDQTPLNQSGIAKEVDKDELNNTVHAIAEDIVRIMDNIYKIIARYRYRVQYDFEKIDESLPAIAVPDHFDLLSSAYMLEEVGKAKTSKANPIVISALEIEYAGKRFINEPEIKQMLELVLKLDPLPNITEDEKMGMLSNKGITKINYIISSNILNFVKRALLENAGFADMEMDKQIEVLAKYAQDQIDADKKETEEMLSKSKAAGDQLPEIADEDEEEIEEPIIA